MGNIIPFPVRSKPAPVHSDDLGHALMRQLVTRMESLRDQERAERDGNEDAFLAAVRRSNDFPHYSDEQVREFFRASMAAAGRWPDRG
jgi:hypothetical protein